MDVVVDRVAGLDVGKASVTVCVRVPGPGKVRVSETRTYSTMTRQLAVMAEWLCQCGVDLAAMESTATYWKPVFYCLEEHMDTWLLNAAHIKAVPGRKSDVRDAEWIARLVEHGLVAPSFVPPPAIRRLRNLTRYRGLCRARHNARYPEARVMPRGGANRRREWVSDRQASA